MDGRRRHSKYIDKKWYNETNSIKPGTVIVVRGYQSKGKLCLPRCIANGRDVTFPDGRKVFMGSSGTGAPRDGADPREKVVRFIRDFFYFYHFFSYSLCNPLQRKTMICMI